MLRTSKIKFFYIFYDIFNPVFQFQTQLASEENEIEKSLNEATVEAERTVAESKMVSERQKLMKKEEKLKRRALSQANKVVKAPRR